MNVLLGPTLAGKTTLMRLMAGLDRPTSGRLARGRRRHHRRAGAQALGRHGVPAVRQLPDPERLREHRLAAARAGPGQGRDRGPGRARRQAAAARAHAAAHAGATVGRPAAAHRHRPRPRQAGASSCCSTSRSPTSTTSCARNCARNCRASSPRPAPSWSMPRPSPPRRCCCAARPRRSGRAASPRSGRPRRSIASPHNLDAARVFSDPPLNELALDQGAAPWSTLGERAHDAGRGRAVAACPTAPIALGFRADAVAVGDGRARPARAFPGTVSVTEISGSESFVHVDVGGSAPGSASSRACTNGSRATRVEVQLDLAAGLRLRRRRRRARSTARRRLAAVPA